MQILRLKKWEFYIKEKLTIKVDKYYIGLKLKLFYRFLFSLIFSKCDDNDDDDDADDDDYTTKN